MVLSKVGGSGEATMASIAASWFAISASKAGLKCSGFSTPKGGRPSGSLHGSSSGLSAISSSRTLVRLALASGRARRGGPFAGLLRGLQALQVLDVELLEVDRFHHQRREAALLHGV